MTPPRVEIAIEAEGWRELPAAAELAQRAVALAARRCGARLAPQAEISLLLADDDTLQQLNAQWRGQDKPTNVLSFPAAAPGALARALILGDIAIAWDTLAAEAQAEGKTVDAHFSHLVVHGFLHLVGYDHVAPNDALRMEAMERLILAELGIADPYADAALAEGGSDEA